MHHKTLTDTGAACGIPPTVPTSWRVCSLPRLTPSMRALQIRVRIFEAEQAAVHWLAEQHYAKANELFAEYVEDQPRLRHMRHVLMNGGGG